MTINFIYFIVISTTSLVVYAADDTALRIDSKFLQTDISPASAITASHGIELFTDAQNEINEERQQIANTERSIIMSTLFVIESDNNAEEILHFSPIAPKISFDSITYISSTEQMEVNELSPIFIAMLLAVFALSGFGLAGALRKKRSHVESN
ncbi:MAG: hypothetical protein LBC96_02950 [Lachnospiraceae bacterium]|jgi:hypothetical protein|nr:hypothetical protein [Lachnospiraceae bacterium]